MRTVDLFCGCGGLSLGFQKTGHEVVAAYDNWDAALDVYRLNFKHPVHKTDLMDTAKASKSVAAYCPEMIVGGPPCQDYSSAGGRDEEGGRAILTVKYAEIVASVHPKWFVMENVANIMKYSKVYDAMQLFTIVCRGIEYAPFLTAAR